jgi:hypothetical protein
MKFKLLGLIAFMLMQLNVFAQQKAESVEVLYFKAQLACCRAKSCDALEKDVQKVVATNFAEKGVTFKEIKIEDPANADLIKKHNARSQTVVIVSNGKSEVIDVSQIVARYSRNRDYETFETQVCEKINQML